MKGASTTTRGLAPQHPRRTPPPPSRVQTLDSVWPRQIRPPPIDRSRSTAAPSPRPRARYAHSRPATSILAPAPSPRECRPCPSPRSRPSPDPSPRPPFSPRTPHRVTAPRPILTSLDPACMPAPAHHNRPDRSCARPGSTSARNPRPRCLPPRIRHPAPTLVSSPS
ncbi:hypothetical protein U9M48_019479 [Paspalum notatum var. saurae]|uniref:Uncharacterized protein n=1 Tax=Paspalum notatum var. saurae TaxID=547442 RepID=A0AAQ3WQS3_PASNO